MSERVHDDDGTFGSKLTEQDVLKAFDYETGPKEPMLTTSEITDALAKHFDIEVSSETVRRRLGEMESDGKVVSKKFGARAKGWAALVAPELSDSVKADIEATEGELERGETVSHDELFGDE
ncbi:helix-turn-helix domain-containing protein (plasmid) [Haloarcula sp. KBTZ06]|uniref:helix-turn-helix domain-containing protein n=1 Tax=Haloarcula sp. KBTZ06 TaxID=3402682 RepID=UPI003B43C4D7